jgi:hypothetical protein
MSRTIRRTKARKHYSRFAKDYTHKQVEEWLDVKPTNTWQSNGMPIRPLEGKEYINRLWHYHSDAGCHEFGFEDAFEKPYQEDEGSFRARNKNELRKWLKDHEYEIIEKPPKLLWDYY